MDDKEWAKIWKNNSKKLKKISYDDIRNLNTMQALINLAPAFEFARINSTLRINSGLVEFKRLLKQLDK